MDSVSNVSEHPSVEKKQQESEEIHSGREHREEGRPLMETPIDSGTEKIEESSTERADESSKLSCVRAITQCSRVLNQHYGRELIEAATTLQSLCNVQDTSLDIIENRHRELIDIRETYQLEEVIEEAQSYYNKLLRLKKEMAALSVKSKELTKRAGHVKEVRAKEQAKKDEERRRLEQMERDLAPRYATGLTN